MRMNRAAKNAATTGALLDAAAETFAQRGFEAATMDEIAARVGLTKGALYYRFATKQDLFLALLDERCAAYVREFDSRLGSDPDQLRDPALVAGQLAGALKDAWPRLFIEFVSYANRDRSHQRQLRSRMAALRDALADGFERGAREAGWRLPTSPAALARTMIVIATGWSVERLADPRGIDEKLLADLLGGYFAGIGAAAVGSR